MTEKEALIGQAKKTTWKVLGFVGQVFLGFVCLLAIGLVSKILWIGFRFGWNLIK